MNIRILLRWALSLGLLAGLLLWLEPSRIAAEISRIHPGWLVLALVAATLPTLLSAWRWRFTAARLGLVLPATTAVADYYLAGFVNQVLPGGVIGDAWRARRHAQASGRSGPAWRAVILERASGQIIVVLLAVLAVLLHQPWRAALLSMLPAAGASAHSSPVWSLALIFSILAILAILAWASRRHWRPLLATFGQDIRRALLARTAWPLQLGSSSLIVLGYLLVFALAARGIGVQVALPELMLLALPVLLAMLIPLSVAGWGFREVAAATVWLLNDLPPEQGVAASISYGLIVLLASLPGALVLTLKPSSKTQLDQ